MSLLTIETWTVADDAAALAAAEAGAVDGAVLGAATDGAATLGATDAPELVHALAVRMTTPMSAAIVRSLAWDGVPYHGAPPLERAGILRIRRHQASHVPNVAYRRSLARSSSPSVTGRTSATVNQ